jgi:hypothetical protein
MQTTSDPLERLTGESDKHYQMYKEYLLTGYTRSVNNISIDFGISPRQGYRIAEKYLWKRRVKLADQQEYHRLHQLYSDQFDNLQKKRMKNAVRLYSVTQENMEKYLDYHDLYLPNKAEKPDYGKLDKFEKTDEHTSRVDKTLKMFHRYEIVCGRIELFFEKLKLNKIKEEDFELINFDDENCSEISELEFSEIPIPATG